MVPWDSLPENIKESNRNQAEHIRIKLDAVGCFAALLDDWDAEPLSFTQEEIEKMAEMEHDRYVEERRRGGWKLGPRNLEKKTNPDLVSWEKLAEGEKDKDRATVRRLPDFLAGVGLKVCRMRETQ